jgi:hypothetical protein
MHAKAISDSGGHKMVKPVCGNSSTLKLADPWRLCHTPAQVFYKVLSKRCRRDAPGSQGFVVDVGGNYG